MHAVSLVVTQLDITKDWVREVLGDLAADDENPAVLRETWRVFFQTGENYVRTAELLNSRRNTVKYRLGKIAPEISDNVEDDRTDVALALKICHLLGARILEPQAPLEGDETPRCNVLRFPIGRAREVGWSRIGAQHHPRFSPAAATSPSSKHYPVKAAVIKCDRDFAPRFVTS